MTLLTQAPLRQGRDLLLTLPAAQLDLAQTLDCGQAFRWREQPDGSFLGAAAGRALHVSRRGEDVVFHDTAPEEYEALWKGYFDLARDYAALGEAFSADPVLREAVGYAPGIRVLRQEPWETLCTFILSANNNIPRIKGIVERLALLCGEQLPNGLYAFPSPEALASLSREELAPLRCGYRDKFLLDAARRVASGELRLEDVAGQETDEARRTLMTVSGVGPKVAECVLLFGFGRVECFPLDTWMKKVMKTLYPQEMPPQLLPLAGIAQQYLFHYARRHRELFQ